jgi:hypothetical protein
MKITSLSLLAALAALTVASAALAGGEPAHEVHEKIVVAISGDDFDLAETDVSHLGVGDAETIVTESGKTIDILRAENGIEIYVDGELMDAHGAMGAHKERHVIHKEIEIICDADDECEELVEIDEDGELMEFLKDDEAHKVIVIRKSGEDEI